MSIHYQLESTDMDFFPTKYTYIGPSTIRPSIWHTCRPYKGVSIQGNERTDLLATEVLSKPISIQEMVASDWKSKVLKLFKDKHTIFYKEKTISYIIYTPR